LEVLRRQLYAGGRIDRPKADFLVALHKRVQHMTPAFEPFFNPAIKDHILAHGRIDAEEAVWLRQMLCGDGAIGDEGRKFLHELKGEAKQVSREFEALFSDSMKLPRVPAIARMRTGTARPGTCARKSKLQSNSGKALRERTGRKSSR
jgi:hypothetical protein